MSNLPALPPDPFEDPTTLPDIARLSGEAQETLMRLTALFKDDRDLGGHFDRKGNEIDVAGWSALRRAELPEYPNGYMRVARHRVTGVDKNDGSTRAFDVSTVWLGLDHGFGATARPLIFETMAFEQDRTGMDELAMDRYATEAEAETGHVAIIDNMIAEYLDPAHPVTTEDTAGDWKK